MIYFYIKNNHLYNYQLILLSSPGLTILLNIWQLSFVIIAISTALPLPSSLIIPAVIALIPNSLASSKVRFYL